uniref:Uncharacterized protein n=1 Tax=Tetranychus urticae TaxID=32264 RepID=T1KI65_TETUR
MPTNGLTNPMSGQTKLDPQASDGNDGISPLMKVYMDGPMPVTVTEGPEVSPPRKTILGNQDDQAPSFGLIHDPEFVPDLATFEAAIEFLERKGKLEGNRLLQF